MSSVLLSMRGTLFKNILFLTLLSIMMSDCHEGCICTVSDTERPLRSTRGACVQSNSFRCVVLAVLCRVRKSAKSVAGRRVGRERGRCGH